MGKEGPLKRALCWSKRQGSASGYEFLRIKGAVRQDSIVSSRSGYPERRHGDVDTETEHRVLVYHTGLAQIGAVAIPATHLLTDKDIIYRANAADIKAIIATYDDNLVDHVNRSMASSPSVKYRIVIGDTIPEGWIDFSKGVEQAPEFVRPAEGTSNGEIMLLYFTSGTTGQPKMVIHDFTYPLGHITTAKFWHNLHENSIHLTLADTGWAKAVWGKLYGQWIVGACVFVYDFEGRFIPADVLEVISKYRVTSLCAPPTIFRFLIREELEKYDLSALEYCTTAGEALNPSVFETFYRKTGIKMMEAFGQTETAPTVVTFPWIEPKPGSMGVPNPLYKMDLLTHDGRSAEDGEQGEIVFRTDGGRPLSLFMGYYRDEELTRSVYADNLYHTGDMAWRDEDGTTGLWPGRTISSKLGIPHRSI